MVKLVRPQAICLQHEHKPKAIAMLHGETGGGGCAWVNVCATVTGLVIFQILVLKRSQQARLLCQHKIRPQAAAQGGESGGVEGGLHALKIAPCLEAADEEARAFDRGALRWLYMDMR